MSGLHEVGACGVPGAVVASQVGSRGVLQGVRNTINVDINTYIDEYLNLI